MKPRSICYLEIPAPATTIEKTAALYSNVFGWQIMQSTMNDKPYWMFTAGEESLSGGFDSTLSPSPSGIAFYVHVEDISVALSAIEKLGGKMIKSKFEIGGDHGYAALFTDPSGNTIGLWSKI